MEHPSISSKISVMIGSCSFNIFLGGMYAWGSINPYVSSYFINEKISGSGATVIVYPLWLLFQTIGALFSLSLGKKIGYRIWAFVALSLFCLNVFTSSFTLKVNAYLFILQFGIMNGFLVGTTYFLPLYSPWTYLPNNKGFVTGATLFFAGFAAVIMNNICRALINPQNKSATDGVYDSTVTDRVPAGIQWLSLFFFSVTLFGSIFFREPWLSKETYRETHHKDAQIKKTSVAPSDDVQNIDNILAEVPTDPHVEKGKDTHDNLMLHIEKAAIGRSEIHVKNSKNILLGGGRRTTGHGISRPTREGYIRNNTDTVNLVALGSDDIVENLAQREIEENPEAFNKSLMEKEDIFEDDEVNECPDLRVALKSRQFIQLFLMGMCGAAYDYFLSSVFKDYGITVEELNNDGYLTNVGSVGALGNALSRLTMGILLDYVEFKWTYGFFLIIQIISGAMILYVKSSRFMYALLIFFGFAGIGAHVSTYPNTTLKIFGNKVGARVYSIVYFSFAFANLGEYTICQIVKLTSSSKDEDFVLGEESSSSYNIVFHILTGTSAFAFLNLLFFNFKPDWSKFYKPEDLPDDILGDMIDRTPSKTTY